MYRMSNSTSCAYMYTLAIGYVRPCFQANACLQGPATWYPSGLSVKSGSHDVSTPATSPHKPASSVATALHDSTAMQRQPPAAAAGEGSSVVHGQQQLASGHSHDSSYATAQPAQPPAGCTAAAAGDQPSAPQQMQHGIPGFAAMPPAQQSAAMLAKWGMAPAPDVQMQQLMQQSQGPQHQQQQESEAGQAQLKELPSPSGTDQQGGPTRSAPAANPSDQDAASHSFTAPDDAMGRPAPEGRLYPTQAAAGSQSARMQDHNSHLGTDMTRRHAIGSGDTTYTSRVGASQTAQQSQEGLQGGTVLVREHNDGNEEGLALEQPDGEGSNPPVTPEVVRGRVVRATELWHRQRLQQEALQQVTVNTPHRPCLCTQCFLLEALLVFA